MLYQVIYGSTFRTSFAFMRTGAFYDEKIFSNVILKRSEKFKLANPRLTTKFPGRLYVFFIASLTNIKHDYGEDL